MPDIDLARIAPQPKDMKRRSLEQMRGGRPPFSYKPLRSCFDDIFNIQPDLDFGSAEPTPWATIEALIDKRGSSEVERFHNKRVARGLHDFATSGRVIGRKHEFFPLAMGAGRKVTFWQSMVIAIDDEPHAIFIEPRRSKGLGAEGRRFAFSMMHERIRAADEDFAEVGLAIVRFDEPNADRRAARLYTDNGVTLYTLDELEQMVAETYEMWRDVCEERERDARRRPTGTDGPLFDHP
ncbi:hypothetical protein [Roseinatronobacter sp. S2]|uniref:type VI toxin-antitoxin system SocB family DNA replication inhibitor toxin n=1 Tax=Roseinatronobacter sp. S2 TaxID=3035471 RepID=UPI0024101F7C|nr:hypothetical protein [Roseinatronobacter sp. S2]WFE74242.1 hypothetical protein P8S53_13775 [Roseinatronobacter sp. S2]